MKVKNLDSFNDFIAAIAKEHSKKTAFEMRRKIVKEKITYDEIPLICRKISIFLDNQKIAVNDKVLIFGINCPEYSLLLLSVFQSSRVAVPIDFRTSDDVLEKIINQTKPKIAFVSRFVKSEVIKKNIENVIYIEDLLSQVKTVEGKRIKKHRRANKRICEIVYTSGTTGIPKGVMITEGNILTNVYALYKRLPKMSAYRTVSILPLSHMFEQIAGLFLSLLYGAKITYLLRVNSFKLRQAMTEIRPTYLLFVPQLLQIFWHRIEEGALKEGKYDLMMSLMKYTSPLPRFIRSYVFKKIHLIFGGKLEFIGIGGAPLNYQIASYFNKMGFKILEGYGATEVTAAACFNPDSDNLGNVDKPLEGVEIKLSKDNEIIIKSDSLSPGYYQNRDKTNQVFKNGWYLTGDIGKLNHDGTLSIVGRDFFKLVLASGEKVYAEDIERIINLNSKIKDCCVIGIEDNGADKIHAVLLLKNEADEEKIKDIIASINSRLESKQQILSYSVWQSSDFPRTPTLKTDRKIVKELVNEGIREKNHPEKKLPNMTAQVDVLDILAEISAIDKSKIADHDLLASDLNLDSLDRGELVASVEEQLGVTVDIVEITSKTTVSDLKQLVKKAHLATDSVQFSSWQYTRWGEIIRLLFFKLLLFPIHGAFARFKIATPENIDQIKEKSILIFNHAGIFDGVCVLRLLDSKAARALTPVYSGFWTKKLISRLVELAAGGLPLDQSGRTLIPLLQYISDLVEEGRFLMYAPQGRLQNRPVQDRFKAGIGYFSQELNLPVVPIKLIDYEKIWGAPEKDAMHMKFKEFLPKKIGTVTIKIGKKINPGRAKNPAELANLIEEQFNKL